MKSLENIKWSYLGKQNLRRKERYYSGGQQFYWNKRKRLHKKRVQLLQDWFRNHHVIVFDAMWKRSAVLVHLRGSYISL